MTRPPFIRFVSMLTNTTCCIYVFVRYYEIIYLYNPESVLNVRFTLQINIFSELNKICTHSSLNFTRSNQNECV